MSSLHEAYLWEAVCMQPDVIIHQEVGGWAQLEPLRYQCIALRFRPQRSGFRPLVIDFRPDEGYVLEWVGWENEVRLNSAVVRTATNKIAVRQYFELPNDDKKYWFDFFYYVSPSGVFIVSNKDFDPMMEKMTGLLDG